MPHDITVTFLGTTSGGGPTDTRNCSSLVFDPLEDGSLWMVDCAEGTVRQFALQPYRGAARLRVSKVRKIFITHMHADHTMGLITLLRTVLGIPPAHVTSSDPPPTSSEPPHVEIYGPAGLRLFVRTNLALTHTRSMHNYAVHELLSPDERPSVGCAEGERHANESPGMNISCGLDGVWRGCVEVEERWRRRVVVDAGPILHRDLCIGYVFSETFSESRSTAFDSRAYVPRTIVILGDTHDPSGIIPLITSPSPPAATTTSAPLSTQPSSSTSSERPLSPPSARRVSLLIHESTDAYIPPALDPQERVGRHANRDAETVLAKTRERGHSTPEMAGAFAKRIGAEQLVLNHIGARFPAPPQHIARTPQDRFRQTCMQEIERQATEAWVSDGRRPQSRGGNELRRGPRGQYAEAAWDFMRVVVPPTPVAAPVTALGDVEESMDVGDEFGRELRFDMQAEAQIEVEVGVEVDERVDMSGGYSTSRDHSTSAFAGGSRGHGRDEGSRGRRGSLSQNQLYGRGHGRGYRHEREPGHRQGNAGLAEGDTRKRRR